MSKHTRSDSGVSAVLSALRARLSRLTGDVRALFASGLSEKAPDPAASDPATSDPGAVSWRYRMLLLATGSTTPDGSDLTASDREVLAAIDRRLADRARVDGAEAAERALLEIVEVLESGGQPSLAGTRH